MSERSGLKAHRTLAPANARYAKRQMRWGGKVDLPRRERFCAANATVIAVMAGQKILFSGRASIMLCSVWTSGEVTRINNGDNISAKRHTAIGMIAHLSIVGEKNLDGP